MISIYSINIPEIRGSYDERANAYTRLNDEIKAKLRQPDIIFVQGATSEFQRVFAPNMDMYSIKLCTGVCVVKNGQKIICPPGYKLKDGEKLLNEVFKVNFITYLSRRRFQWVSSEEHNTSIIDKLNGERTQTMPIFDNILGKYIIVCNGAGSAKTVDISAIKLFRAGKSRPRAYGWISTIFDPKSRAPQLDTSMRKTAEKKHLVTAGGATAELYEYELV